MLGAGYLLEVIGYGLFQKKSKQVTERDKDIDLSGILRKGLLEIPGVN